VLVVIKCIYLLPTYLHFIQDIEVRCLLLMSSTSFVDLPFQEHQMMEKHHMDQNPCISLICPK
jgi:flagellar biosynthesis protein FlhB